MTSKEQLAYYKQQCEEQANYIIELQLQLEQLEDSSKIRMQQIDKYATTLTEKYLDLKQENEKLKNENKENAEFYVKSRDALWDLKQQNEKLKKEKEQIKEWVVNKIKFLDKGVFLMSGERVNGAIEILNELLKEVLDNEVYNIKRIL